MWIKSLVMNASELNVAEEKAFFIKASKKEMHHMKQYRKGPCKKI